MATRRTPSEPTSRRRQPATTPERRENQMIVLAEELAEKQLRDGTASSQVMSHYLKLGTTRERLEQERLQRENLLLEAKIKQIESGENIEALFRDAINAFRGYQGQSVPEDEFDD